MEPAAQLVRHQPSAVPMSPNYTTPRGMSREEFRAMGTAISLLLPESQAAQGLQIVQTLFAEWEQTLSRFLPESELSRLNYSWFEARGQIFTATQYRGLARA